MNVHVGTGHALQYSNILPFEMILLTKSQPTIDNTNS